MRQEGKLKPEFAIRGVALALARLILLHAMHEAVLAQVRREDFDFSVPKAMCRGVKDQIEFQNPERANLPVLLHLTTHTPFPVLAALLLRNLN